MILWLNQLQHARDKNVVFVGILEKIVDEFNHAEWQLQMEGSKTARELPAHRRPDHHLSVSEFRRRQAADPRLCLHLAEPLELSGQGSQRPTRSDRAAGSRKTSEQTHPPPNRRKENVQ